MIRKYATALLALMAFLPLLASPSWAADAAAPEKPELQPTLERPMHAFPRVGGFEVLWGDFHIHTIHSDGKLTPAERVLEAWRYGYDAIAITDHGNYKAYKEALPLAKTLGLILIRGLETGVANKEHFVALGVSEDYEPRNPHRWAESQGQEQVFYQEELRRIAEDGGVVIYAHPHVGLREPTLWGIGQGIIQGVEVKNGVVGRGWNTAETHGTWCYPWGLEWAKEHNLAVFANSDAHGRRGENAEPVTLLFVKKRSDKGVLDAIRGRRTIAWFDGMLWGGEKVLADLIRSSIGVRHTRDESGGGWLRLENRGPVALKAALQAECVPKEAVEIGPYAEVLVRCDDLKDTLAIRWENIWTSPKDNLVTTHDCRSAR